MKKFKHIIETLDLKKFISYLDKNKKRRITDIVNTIYRLTKTKRGPDEFDDLLHDMIIEGTFLMQFKSIKALYCFQDIKIDLGYSTSLSYYFKQDKKYRLIEIHTHTTQQALDSCILTNFGNDDFDVQDHFHALKKKDVQRTFHTKFDRHFKLSNKYALNLELE
jgi:hypothetical protein